MREPGHENEEPAAPVAASFGPEFDGYFRAAFARAAQQAREFVDFVRPEAGEAVVEVGAGSGRITFDGGLAERIGPEGQLLVTDPSATQLAIARRRAEDLGLDWVRFVAAPVEDLPIAAGTLDLVLGSTFLHFTDARVTLQAMARAVRSGGRVAVNAIASPRFGSGLLWVLEPALAEMRAAGLTLDDIWVPRARVEGAFTTAGLQIDRAVESSQEQWAAPSAAVAIGFVRQSGLTRLLLRGLAHIPEERRREIEESVEERIREGFGRPDLPWAGDGRTLTLVAHRP